MIYFMGIGDWGLPWHHTHDNDGEDEDDLRHE